MTAVATANGALRARRVAIAIGERLLDELAQPDRFDINAERYPSRRMNGSVGFALVFLALAQATGDARFEAAMHAQLARAARAEGDEYGLFTGFAGLRAVASLASAVEPRYQRLVAQCDGALDRRPADDLTDLIGGSAGITIARSFANASSSDRELEELARAIAARVDCLGLAHGLPGMLLAYTCFDERASERSDLVRRAISDLLASARTHEDAVVWPRFASDPADEACRSVWCYGTPGVAVALLTIARRLKDDDLRACAREALDGLTRIPRSALLLTEHGLCHGTMGNAVVYYTAGRLCADERFAEIAQSYADEAIAAMERDDMRTLTRGRDGIVYDALGHLNGIAGIALGLLTIYGFTSDEWMKLHGLFG